ncbi:LysR substrate-binding domain-containing protein [Tomitella gaofuii]|uniref:LysR substrate-binding domain-containing protein n=1 Tax=Tomitella gaofuii TaxID=2760083 RepID=UPI0015F93195|nr:LysR substrate-binding domain-containing protein [Tomitella gaofuii]
MIDESYRPTVAQLRAFVAVAEYRHFSTAAQRLGVSQPTLSQALASLESGLGVVLMERSTRKVLVTEAGRELLGKALAALEAVDGFVTAAAGIGSGMVGGLRIGMIPTVAPYLLPAALPALGAAYPDLHPHLVEDQTERLLDALRGGALDVAVIALPSGAAGLVEIPLFDEDFVLVLPEEHPLAGRDDLSADVLDELPLLLLDEGHCLRDQTLDLCRLVGATPALGDTRATSLATVVQCVGGGLGVTLVPESAVPAETTRAGLATARFADPAPGRTIGLVYRKSTGRHDDFRSLAVELAACAPAGRAYAVD